MDERVTELSSRLCETGHVCVGHGETVGLLDEVCYAAEVAPDEVRVSYSTDDDGIHLHHERGRRA